MASRAAQIAGHLNWPQGMLAGQVAIITGSGQGIGAEAARLFANEGAKVIVSDIDGGQNLPTSTTQSMLIAEQRKLDRLLTASIKMVEALLLSQAICWTRNISTLSLRRLLSLEMARFISLSIMQGEFVLETSLWLVLTCCTKIYLGRRHPQGKTPSILHKARVHGGLRDKPWE